MSGWVTKSLRALVTGLGLMLAACAPASTPDAGDASDTGPAASRGTLNFGIIATESSANQSANWGPFIEAMEEWTGYDIQPFYASDYAGMIQGMRYNSVQFAWFSNFSGLQAVRLADGEVFAKATYPDGSEGYNSVLIVPADSPIQTLDDILTCDGSIDFGMGDPNSTSGYLVPSAFIFAPRNIDPAECFNSVRNANHEANAVAVANGLIDVGTNNTTSLTVLHGSRPEIAERIRVIWTSPSIGTDPIIWRNDLDEEAKLRLQSFFMNYGRRGTPEEIAEARAVLGPLFFGLFLPASNSHLDPIVQLEIVRDLILARNNTDLTEEERASRVAALEARLAEVEAGNTELVSLSSATGQSGNGGEAELEPTRNWPLMGGLVFLAGLLLAGLLWAGAPRGPGPKLPLTERLANAFIAAGVIIILVWSFDPADMDRSYLLVENFGDMQEFLAGFFPDDISSAASRGTYWTELRAGIAEAVPQMIITVQIAIWGTFIAVIAAIPFGLLSARNVAPAWVVQPVRRLMDVFRSINELIIALIFIAAVGLGPLAGVMALAIHTTGVLAKLFSEAVEAIDHGPVEGVRATGALPLHEVIWGVIPQVAPLWTSFGLYRFESNARSATVLGLIGAGGIGQILFEAVRAFDYQRTAAIVIVIILAVSAIDMMSQLLRKRLL
ncbi:phosphonate ABC transporter, permease protein PhnE [Maricaulis salignorans]|uniref:Phosphonate ABC transporter, permease protein PhnE/phosphonate ABC transporter binding protein,TIGR03431 n=1 Tax=Maricaulis salignorans TaxID=144026 RepID=A0A1G9NGA4_9PROT|nr:phosphonate ABC transporter, permease protein PhnE [Maricaulis salignorans]SDL85394.1 phosphonate ABC transporter, permease protein PhnE/phosphonate ABC transporter binding protein,TIGR03431 [Maricaulis salignorans]